MVHFAFDNNLPSHDSAVMGDGVRRGMTVIVAYAAAVVVSVLTWATVALAAGIFG